MYPRLIKCLSKKAVRLLRASLDYRLERRVSRGRLRIACSPLPASSKLSRARGRGGGCAEQRRVVRNGRMGSSEVRLELTGTGTSQMAAQINRANLGAGITACALIFGRRGIFFIYLYIFIIYNTIYYCSRSRLLCRSCSRASRRSNRSTTSPSSSSATLHQPAARSSTVAYASASLPSTSCAL